MPINYALKDIIEKNQSQHLCLIHNEAIKFFCKDDNQSVCGNCAIVGDHKGHDVVQLKTIKEDIEKRLTDYESAYHKLITYEGIPKRMIISKKRDLIDTLTTQFDVTFTYFVDLN